HAVECMSKLMEQGGHFIKRQQGRLALGRFGEIANDRNMGSFIGYVFYGLRFVGGHPSAIALSGTREKIGIKNGHEFAFAIGNFVSQYILMVLIYMGDFLKMQSI